MATRGRYGYINRKGSFVIPTRFDDAGPFKGGLARVKIGLKWGFVDRKGLCVIEPQFDFAEDFSEGFARVGVGETWGYIDDTGSMAVRPDPTCTWGGVFSEGYATARQGKLWGYIDTTGTFVVKPQFEAARRFMDGRGVVVKNGSFRTIDKHGNQTILSDGDLPFKGSEGLILFSLRGAYGFMDRAGTMVIPPRYEQAGIFSNKLAPVLLDGLWGYIDREMNVRIRARFDLASSFSDGLAQVEVADKWGYIDTKGKIVIEPCFDRSSSFSEGLACVRTGDRWGFADDTGEMVVPARFSWVGAYYGGLAAVRLGDRFGCIDEAGRFVIKPRFDRHLDFPESQVRLTELLSLPSTTDTEYDKVLEIWRDAFDRPGDTWLARYSRKDVRHRILTILLKALASESTRHAALAFIALDTAGAFLEERDLGILTEFQQTWPLPVQQRIIRLAGRFDGAIAQRIVLEGLEDPFQAEEAARILTKKRFEGATVLLVSHFDHLREAALDPTETRLGEVKDCYLDALVQQVGYDEACRLLREVLELPCARPFRRRIQGFLQRQR